MEQLIAQFENFQTKIKQAETRFAAVGELQGELAELEVRKTSGDATVTVVIGPAGAVRDIQLTASAMHLSPGQLSATIMSTLRQAVAAAAREQAEIIDQTMGGALGVSMTDQVLQAQAEAFGVPVDQPRESEPTSDSPLTQAPTDAPAVVNRPHRERRPDDDGDEGFDTIFNR
jgi:DNA-binding protein YbaB